MADYTELHDLAGQNILLSRITVAITVAANTVLTEDVATANHANRFVWAKQAFFNPEQYAKPCLHVLLADNASATVGQITAVLDSVIQEKVNAVIDLFAGV